MTNDYPKVIPLTFYLRDIVLMFGETPINFQATDKEKIKFSYKFHIETGANQKWNVLYP